MIFERALRREFTQAALGIFVALFAILLSTQLIRLLNDAARGRLAPEAVAALLGFAALNYLPVILSLALFMSVLLSLSRAYRDSEMVVWFSSGVSLVAWLKPVLRFAVPVVVVIAALSLFLSPWALSKSAEYRGKLEARNETSQVSPGAFLEASGGNRIVFVESASEETGEVKNVFVAMTSPKNAQIGVVTADAAHPETMANGDRFLVLDHGQRYEVEPGLPEFKVMAFAHYGVRVADKPVQDDGVAPKAMPLGDLWARNDAAARAEMLWRFSLPLAALFLALLAIPLSFVNPRAGRSINMIMAIFIYVLYNNMLSVTQAWVARGIAPFTLSFLAPHLLMFTVLSLLFYKRLALSFWRRAR
ncbi:MAG: LPS export ABC transporter permease LptF [Zoogloeaceae bacterium]|jgi:lipopolysaccharide export system permease protein|nr:LPS export ABC transporter permease LptF [Zoogloeaceae bacterium]